MESAVPQTTTNSLRDIIWWLKKGDMVILHTIHGRRLVYHINSLPFNRKIYVDVSAFPSLLNEGEWPYYIVESGAREMLNDSKECSGGTFEFVLP